MKEAVKLIPQDKVQNCTVKHIVGPKRVSERIEKHINVPVSEVAEQIVAVPVPRSLEETGDMIQLIPEGRISYRVGEQSIDCPVL